MIALLIRAGRWSARPVDGRGRGTAAFNSVKLHQSGGGGDQPAQPGGQPSRAGGGEVGGVHRHPHGQRVRQRLLVSSSTPRGTSSPTTMSLSMAANDRSAKLEVVFSIAHGFRADRRP